MLRRSFPTQSWSLHRKRFVFVGVVIDVDDVVVVDVVDIVVIVAGVVAFCCYFAFAVVD